MTPEYRKQIAAAFQDALRRKTSREFVVTPLTHESMDKDLNKIRATMGIPPTEQIFGTKVTVNDDETLYTSTIVEAGTPLPAEVFDLLIEDMSSEFLIYIQRREKRNGGPVN